MNAEFLNLIEKKTNVNDNLTKLNFRYIWTQSASPDETELKMDEIEWRGDENGRENLYYQHVKITFIETHMVDIREMKRQIIIKDIHSIKKGKLPSDTFLYIPRKIFNQNCFFKM